MADDTAFVIEQLGIGPADVLGISQGGMIAQYLAIDHPLLVNKLALGVTASRQNGTMQGVINNWIQLAKQSEYQAIVIDMLKNMYSPAYIKKYGWLFPLLSRIGKPKDFSRFIALAEACLTCNAYSELDKISCPVFVIGGSKDRIVTGRASEEIAKKLNCEMYMYPELGHSAYEEATDFNARIYRFLTE